MYNIHGDAQNAYAVVLYDYPYIHKNTVHMNMNINSNTYDGFPNFISKDNSRTENTQS